jgi:endonuclease YncB( thermonuclease family)
MSRLIRKAGFCAALGISSYMALPHLNPILSAKEKLHPGAIRNVEYVYNYDGDTFTIDIEGIDPVFGKNISVRIAHIDAAELDSKDKCEKASAELAKTKLTSILRAARKIDIVNVGRDKYFRLLADVVVEEEMDVASFLKSEKIVVPYEGGTKPITDWCQYPPNKK